MSVKSFRLATTVMCLLLTSSCATQQQFARERAIHHSASLGGSKILECDSATLAFTSNSASSPSSDSVFGSAFSESIVTWRKQGHDVPVFVQFGGYPPHVYATYAGRIRPIVGTTAIEITDLRASDEGWYKCSIVHLDRDADEGAVNGTWIYLAVNDEPRISEAPRDQKVADNGIVSLVCRATGNPPPDVYWRRAGRRATDGRHRRYTATFAIPHGSLLRIEPVRKRWDEGIFECVADNGIDDPVTAAANITIYADGTEPAGYPRIVESPYLKAVEKGRNTSMVCRASGNPEPTISWFKDLVSIDHTDPRLRILPTGSLQIIHSKESDEGKYECVAENSHGVAYSYGANLYVRVRRVPPHFTVVPENVEVMPGGAVNLTCVVVGSPMPVVTWRLGTVELTPEIGAPIGRNVLMLTDVRETATYTCVGTSDIGNVKHDVEVKVKDLQEA